ncbi:MAG TPA: hypothetical protein PK250_08285, partial [Syntrophobacter fumaroxidans]|nr:hypothetical protein [Syntrophobacter fumaroxidans]
MRRYGTISLLTLVLALWGVGVAMSQSPPGSKAGEEPVMVGRISHVEGELLRYVPDDQDWVATVKDAPFGLDDALYSSEDGKGEFIMPNQTWLRVGATTQVQLIALRPDVTECDVASGVTRAYNKSSDTVIKTTTPFGYVVAPPGTIFDVYVGDESMEVICITGTVDFVMQNETAKYQVSAGSSSILCDGKEVEDGAGTVDSDWDDWNAARDDLWTKRVNVKGDSVRYMPPELQDDAYDLDENGRWDTVEYEGQQRTMWRPTKVQEDWEPFTEGRWTEWNEDQTWVPEEDFGYTTHHYGNWVRPDSCGCWYWTPPVRRVRRVAVGPVWDTCTCWYPGRVAWIGTGVDVGWFPLAPFEPYYTHRWWGPGVRVVGGVGFAGININIGGYRWWNRAVIVNHNNFYGVNNYRNVRITNITRNTIINNYHGSTVVNNKILNNYANNKQKYNFNNKALVHNKPHNDIVRRINNNRQIAKQSQRLNARTLENRTNRIRTAQAGKAGRIQQPKATNRLVSANERNKPRIGTPGQQRNLKGNVKSPRQISMPGRQPTDRTGTREGRQGIRSPRDRRDRIGGPATPQQRGDRQQLQQQRQQQRQQQMQQQRQRGEQQQQQRLQQQQQRQQQRQQQMEQQKQRGEQQQQQRLQQQQQRQ